MKSSSEEDEEEDVELLESVRRDGEGEEGESSQPRVWSSLRIRRTIMSSGTRVPARIADSALMPGFFPVSKMWGKARKSGEMF